MSYMKILIAIRFWYCHYTEILWHSCSIDFQKKTQWCPKNTTELLFLESLVPLFPGNHFYFFKVVISIIYSWLVVWNIFIFPYIGNNHPNWLILFRGVRQPPTSWYCSLIFEIFSFFGLSWLMGFGRSVGTSLRRNLGTTLYLFCAMHT